MLSRKEKDLCKKAMLCALGPGRRFLYVLIHVQQTADREMDLIV